MGNIFTLTEDIKKIARDSIDDLINQLGKDCRLVYPPVMTPCGNCVYDAIGQKSSNRYLHGGPIPFSFGTCPMCNGAGFRAENSTEIIKMLCTIEPKNWFIPVANVRIPDCDLQTKGYLSQVTKVLQCTEMIIQPQIEASLRQKFKLASAPTDVGNIIQGRYFVAMWTRIG